MTARSKPIEPRLKNIWAQKLRAAIESAGHSTKNAGYLMGIHPNKISCIKSGNNLHQVSTADWLLIKDWIVKGQECSLTDWANLIKAEGPKKKEEPDDGLERMKTGPHVSQMNKGYKPKAPTKEEALETTLKGTLEENTRLKEALREADDTAVKLNKVVIEQENKIAELIAQNNELKIRHPAELKEKDDEINQLQNEAQYYKDLVKVEAQPTTKERPITEPDGLILQTKRPMWVRLIGWSFLFIVLAVGLLYGLQAFKEFANPDTWHYPITEGVIAGVLLIVSIAWFFISGAILYFGIEKPKE